MKLSAVFSLLFVILILLLSFIVHEGVHWLQFAFDPDLKPVGLAYMPPGSVVGKDRLAIGAPAVEVEPRHSMTQAEFSALLDANRPALEIEAYIVQALFAAAAFIGLLRWRDAPWRSKRSQKLLKNPKQNRQHRLALEP